MNAFRNCFALFISLFLLLPLSAALAEESPASATIGGADGSTDISLQDAPATALCIVNAANVGQYKKQDLDAALRAQLETCAADALAASSTVVDAYETDYLLHKASIEDPFAASDGELAEALSGSNADYALLVRLEPFQHKNKQSMFSFKVQSSGALTVRVVDLATGSVLFETQLTASAEKKDVTSYNQVIPLVMEKLCAELTKALGETYPYGNYVESSSDAA